MSADLHSEISIFVSIVEFTAVLLSNVFGDFEYSTVSWLFLILLEFLNCSKLVFTLKVLRLFASLM